MGVINECIVKTGLLVKWMMVVHNDRKSDKQT